MEGYVKNVSPLWRHAMKRSVGPGEKVSLDDLYEQYGIKHQIEEGDPFVEWLRQVKLRNTDVWEIRYGKTQVVESGKPMVVNEEKVAEVRGGSKLHQSPFVKSEAEIEEIANLSVRKAREQLPRITNQKLLKYALNEVSKLSHKDTLCRMLRKRIVELELSRR